MGKVTVLERPSAAADGGDHFPYQRPRTAATLILLDHSNGPAKVLMGRRHAGHRFMPGKFVFPGGRIEAADRRMSALGSLAPEVEAKLQLEVVRPSAARARALALAAIRETFEETGILLGAKEKPLPRPAPPGPWTDFSAHGVVPSLANVRFIARAITPPGRPKRFDTHFLCMDAGEIAHRVDNVVTAETELVELVWIPLPDARGLELPSITHMVLDELDKRLAGGMQHDLPVPFFHLSHRRWLREEL